MKMNMPPVLLQRRSKKYADKPVPRDIKLRKARTWREPKSLCAKPGYSQFVDFAMRELIPLLSLEGYKREKKRELLCSMLYHLMFTGIRGELVRDTRNLSESGVELRAKLWDMLVDHGWSDIVLGSRSERRWTRYCATPALLQHLPSIQEMFRSKPLARNSASPERPVEHAVVYGHSGKYDLLTGKKLPKSDWKQPLPFPDNSSIDFQSLYAMEWCVADINRDNALHDWRIQLTPGVWVTPDIDLHQRHVGRWNTSLGLFTSGMFSAQSLQKSIRRTMTINGEATVELDFSSMVPRMIYHSKGIQAPGDLYRCDQIFPTLKQSADGDAALPRRVRNFIKKATNIVFNVCRRGTAIQAISCCGREYLRDARFRRFFREDEGLTYPLLVERIERVHSEVDWSFYHFIGMDMMTSQNLIMLLSLSEITATGRPALGIHDAILCRKSDADFVESTMIRNYNWRFPGFTPEIRRSTNH